MVKWIQVFWGTFLLLQLAKMFWFMEAARSFKMSVSYHGTMHHHNPENHNLNSKIFLSVNAQQ